MRPRRALGSCNLLRPLITPAFQSGRAKVLDHAGQGPVLLLSPPLDRGQQRRTNPNRNLLPGFRAAARALARMFREGPRLVFTRPMPIQKSKNVFARPDTNHQKGEVESFRTMLNEGRPRPPPLVVDNDNTPPPACPAA